MASKSVALITMSTRGTRVGPSVSSFVEKIIEKPLTSAGFTIANVDLVKFNLPVYNEPVAPAMVPDKAQFKYEHSRAWSAEIKKHDGYVLVIPEYNYSVAGGTKNAIDYLMNEWKGKPVAIVSYGTRGGTSASEQVKGALSGMGLRVAETRPALAFNQPDIFTAIGGKLGDATLKAWEAEQTANVAKAAEDLKDLLMQPNTPANALRP
ncbi:NADPH-dependent FMN reductase family protein [Annulohypoxylon truncatum]|uniref:NADPH-dependent FMN reductase family protein n=1 Tax=Annulohypoxylon truncatum TaxID=327061 RepID=UPI0020085A1A|nr:NADPH-dependent FMN reductase family protein [Annulohypoxylon truncatum]KAI1214982.1 NADPH-dependent FMN reductase family protein [Annulohypoxylon truncatum]